MDESQPLKQPEPTEQCGNKACGKNDRLFHVKSFYEQDAGCSVFCTFLHDNRFTSRRRRRIITTMRSRVGDIGVDPPVDQFNDAVAALSQAWVVCDD